MDRGTPNGVNCRIQIQIGSKKKQRFSLCLESACDKIVVHLHERHCQGNMCYIFLNVGLKSNWQINGKQNEPCLRVSSAFRYAGCPPEVVNTSSRSCASLERWFPLLARKSRPRRDTQRNDDSAQSLTVRHIASPLSPTPPHGRSTPKISKQTSLLHYTQRTYTLPIHM